VGRVRRSDAIERTQKYKQWTFDPTDVPQPIADKLIYHENFFGDEPSQDTVLSIVLDTLLEELPKEQEDAVRLLYIMGLSQHKAAKIIGCSHKTVKSRADKGIATLRARLTDASWIADLLGGLIPTENTVHGVDGGAISSALKSLVERRARGQD
jgi:DNA-directed RNA polymerase specialized sigma24 family protein